MGDKPVGDKPHKERRAWQKGAGECNYTIDAPYLASICSTNDSYLVAGSLTGSCDVDTTNASTPLLPVQVLLDTGVVVDNYCSKAIGVWMRQNCPESWTADSTSEPVNLAAVGTATAPLGSCIIDLILTKYDCTRRLYYCVCFEAITVHNRRYTYRSIDLQYDLNEW
jgi:hypothetical protein